MNSRILLAGNSNNQKLIQLWQLLSVREWVTIRCNSVDSLLLRMDEPGGLPHLLLVDVEMLTDTLYQFCRTHKHNYPTCRLLLLTDQVLPEVRRWAMAQGAADMVSIASSQEWRQLLQKINGLMADQPVQKPEARLTEDARPGAATRAVVAGLQQLSQKAALDFGRLSVTNYWRETREQLSEQAPHLDLFAVEFNSKIRFSVNREQLTTAETHAVHRWVTAFIERCRSVQPDFLCGLGDAELSAEQRLALGLKQVEVEVDALHGIPLYGELV